MDIRIGTSEIGGTFHSQAEAIGTLARREGPFASVALAATETASIGNALLLDEGRVDFGFLAANWIGLAARGEAPFDRPIDLRIAAPANSGPLFFVVRAESGLRNVDEIGGRRVSVGPAVSGMARHAAGIFAVLGIGPADCERVHLDFADGADALVRGEIDVQLQCPVPNAVMTRLAERADIRVLDYTPGRLEQLIAAVPFYRPAIVRAGAFRGHDRDSAQPGVLNLVAAHRRAPDGTVAALAGLMARRHRELAALNPLFDGLGALFAPLRRRGPEGLEIDGVPLHPGAIDAFRRCGLLP